MLSSLKLGSMYWGSGFFNHQIKKLNKILNIVSVSLLRNFFAKE